MTSHLVIELCIIKKNKNMSRISSKWIFLECLNVDTRDLRNFMFKNLLEKFLPQFLGMAMIHFIDKRKTIHGRRF